MPVHFGRPGSIRYTGKLLAQLRVCLAKCNEILTYNTRQAAKVPPVTVLSPLNLASFTACVTACNQMIAAKN